MSKETNNDQIALINKIDMTLEEMRVNTPLTLPLANSSIVNLSVKRIEGNYDITNSKRDTDNAIDLLYIAYNTTPQAEGQIRVQISSLMSRLIDAQHNSMRTMNHAMNCAQNISNSLRDNFPDWLDIRAPVVAEVHTDKDVAEVIDFVKVDLIQLAVNIQKKAIEVQKALQAVESEYDTIILDTEKITAESEISLSKRLDNAAEIKRQINENNAQRAKIESLVEDLRAQVEKFEKQAQSFKEQAESAEERAFIMSIVNVAAQVVATVIPAVALMSSGGAAIGAAACASAASKSSAKAGEGSTDEAISTESEIHDKKAELVKENDLIKKNNDEIKELKVAKDKEENNNTKDKIEERIESRRQANLDASARIKTITEGIAALEGRLEKMSQAIEKASDKLQGQATSLREMQMQMLEKSEQYEKERRNQSGELERIKVLLQGQQTEEETLQLSIESLNISISALKRMQEIVREIAFFFKSFADFMGQVATNSENQLEYFEKTASSARLRSNALKALIKNTDLFFLSQSSDWYAVAVVSANFSSSFSEGASKLNKLKGAYITGAELKEYFKTASLRLTEISHHREKQSDNRIAILENCKAELELVKAA